MSEHYIIEIWQLETSEMEQKLIIHFAKYRRVKRENNNNKNTLTHNGISQRILLETIANIRMDAIIVLRAHLFHTVGVGLSVCFINTTPYTLLSRQISKFLLWRMFFNLSILWQKLISHRLEKAWHISVIFPFLWEISYKKISFPNEKIIACDKKSMLYRVHTFDSMRKLC